MTNTPLKSNNIVDLGLELLKQEVVTPRVFWRVAEAEFTRTTDDTVTIRVPAYATASKRTMRSGTAINAADFAERGVDVTINTHLYHRTDISSEELTLDITDFGAQILQPQVEAVARGLEDECVNVMTGASYQNAVNWDYSDPIASVTAARGWLNRAHVPANGRVLMVGPSIEESLLGDERLLDASASGSTGALRDATIGRLRGFDVVANPNLPDDVAVAFHTSAFALVTRAPARPAGVAFGATAASDGFAMRWLRDYDNSMVADRSLVDLFCGTAAVTDLGHWDDTTNRFVPAVDPEGVGESSLLVRAVLLGTDVEES